MRPSPLFVLVCAALLLAACGTSRAEVSTPSPDIAARSPSPAPEPTLRPFRLRPGELVLAADTDAIPAITATPDLFVGIEAGDQEWSDREPVVGLVVGEQARAYPVRLLSQHEIVNDRIGGRPIAVTWCPLCYSALVFDRMVDRELTFGVSGYLLHNNLVMYDRQTNTLWSQLLAQGIRGALRGRRLATLPAELTTWGAWKVAHPQTRVLSAAQLGQQADEVVDPYVGYYTSGATGLSGPSEGDDRLKGKTLVVGVTANERGTLRARAYPLEVVRSAGAINDQIGPLPLLLVYDQAFQTVLTYRRRVDDQVLTFESASEPGLLRDQETGTLWQVQAGLAIEGPRTGDRLSRVTAPLVFWFAWSDLYAQTEIYVPRVSSKGVLYASSRLDDRRSADIGIRCLSAHAIGKSCDGHALR